MHSSNYYLGQGDKLGSNKDPVDDLLRISVTLTLDEKQKQ